MDNLLQMKEQMIAQGIDANIFDVIYNNHPFTCIFLIQDYGTTLLLTMFIGPDDTKTISIDMDAYCTTPRTMSNEEYRILARYLGFTGATGKVFTPSDFFNQFDTQINPMIHREPTTQEKTRAIGRSLITIEDENKVYFCGWKHNGTNGSVSNKNFIKTRRMIGERLALKLRKANISSRWTANEYKEDLSRINDYLNSLEN